MKDKLERWKRIIIIIFFWKDDHVDQNCSLKTKIDGRLLRWGIYADSMELHEKRELLIKL